MPVGAPTFAEGLRMGVEVFHALKAVLQEKGLATAVGDEGGFAPNLGSNREALDVILQAVERAGYKPGDDIVLALDVASTEMFKDGVYHFAGEGVTRNTEEMIAFYEELVKNYPIVSMEDPLSEDEWEAWAEITRRLGDRVQLVGDDLFVTNTKRLARGIKEGVANSILVKVNQIGTLTETFDAVEMAKRAGYTAIISHRSGETEDATIADIAVVERRADQDRCAFPPDRVAKYNQLLRIEEGLADLARYPGKGAFYNLKV